jgi:predicted nucleic acid-binding protein
MPADVFFDSSVLLYLVSPDDARARIAEGLLSQGGRISVQVLNEFAAVARRKTAMSWNQIEEALAEIRLLCETPIAMTVAIHEAGLQVAKRYGFHLYDSMIVAAALESGSKVLYSEDMEHGQKIVSITIRNPFPKR